MVLSALRVLLAVDPAAQLVAQDATVAGVDLVFSVLQQRSAVQRALHQQGASSSDGRDYSVRLIFAANAVLKYALAGQQLPCDSELLPTLTPLLSYNVIMSMYQQLQAAGCPAKQRRQPQQQQQQWGWERGWRSQQRWC